MGIQISDPFRETELKPKLGMQGRAFSSNRKPRIRPSSFAALQAGFGVTKPDLVRSGALRPSIAAQRFI